MEVKGTVSERDRLETLRNELQAAKGPQLIDPKLVDLLDASDAGDGVVRREMLATLLSDIDFSQGRVVGYAPRSDRQYQVTRLVDTIS